MPLGEPATSINRWYLKMKSELMPYAYSIAKEAVDGKPMIRAMFLEYPNQYTYGKATEYQFMYGMRISWLPLSIRKHRQMKKVTIYATAFIYRKEPGWTILPEKNMKATVLSTILLLRYGSCRYLVKSGAIIPMTNLIIMLPRSIRTCAFMKFIRTVTVRLLNMTTMATQAYLKGEGVTTRIESEVGSKNNVTITIRPAVGSFDGFVKDKATELRINVSEMPKKWLPKLVKQGKADGSPFDGRIPER